MAGATIELQQKEDEIETKNREIEELVGEHETIVEAVEQEWRGRSRKLEGRLRNFGM